MPLKPGASPERLVLLLRSRSGAMSQVDAVRQFSRSALQAATRSGELTRLLPGAYVATEQREEPLVRLRAASAWLGRRGAVTGLAALAVWGYRDRYPARFAVQVATNLHLSVPRWIRVVRPNTAPEWYRVKGVRVVAAEYAVVQAWNDSVGDEGVSVVVEAVKRGMLRSRIVAAVAATPRVRSRAQLGALLDLLDGGVTSYLEWLARSKVFTRKRFPDLIWQHTVHTGRGTRHPDAYDAEAKIDLEFDGAGTHSGDSGRRSDIERDAELAGLGILTLRFTMEDLLHRPEWCVQRYLDARRARIGR